MHQMIFIKMQQTNFRTVESYSSNLFRRRCVCPCVCLFEPFGYLGLLVNIKDEKNIFEVQYNHKCSKQH